MSTTVAAIAGKAFNAIASKIGGVIKTCILTRKTNGAYNPATGAHSVTVATSAGRAILDQSTPIADVFPAYVAGPSDKLWYLEGMTFAPLENDSITIGGTNYTVTAVGDIAGAGSFFSIVAR